MWAVLISTKWKKWPFHCLWYQRKLIPSLMVWNLLYFKGTRHTRNMQLQPVAQLQLRRVYPKVMSVSNKMLRHNSLHVMWHKCTTLYNRTGAYWRLGSYREDRTVQGDLLVPLTVGYPAAMYIIECVLKQEFLTCLETWTRYMHYKLNTTRPYI